MIVTADHDFPRLVALAAGGVAGIVLFRLDNPDAATSSRRLAEALDEMGDETDLRDTVVVIEPRRLRVHRFASV